MKRTALAAFTFVLGAPLAAQMPWSELQMREDLEEIAAAAREEWSYRDHRARRSGVDVGALLEAAKGELAAVRTVNDFARIVRRFGASLQDGHAWTFVPGEAPRGGRERTLPFRLADCEEGLAVVAVAPAGDVPARGEVLVAIDGVPVADLLAAAEREVFASTPGMRRSLALLELHRHANERVACTFAAADAQRTIDVATLPTWVPMAEPRTEAENWSVRWPRPDVAVLRIATFMVPRWKEWREAKPEERDAFLAEGRARIDAIVGELLRAKATALILDLRGNGGGTDLLGIHLAERLLERPFHYFLLSAKHGDRWAFPMGITYGAGEHERFAGRVLALIDEDCFSTTDNLLRCLDDLHPDFVTIGRPTGGGTGAPRELVKARHTGAVLGACTQRVSGPKRKLIEGHGTTPDVAVRWRAADWLEGRDPDLDAAVRLLAEKQ